MSFALSPDQVELRAVVREFLEKQAPMEAVRAAADSDAGHDTALWARMTRELGLAGLGVPEEHGGTGDRFSDVAVVAQELGRALTPSPFFSSVVLATQLLLASGDDDACAAFLPDLAAGELTGTAALVEPAGDWSFAALATTARDETGEGDWVVTGEKRYVTDAHTAGLILVLAESEPGPTLLAVRAGAPGLATTRVEALDATRPLGTVTFADTPAALVGNPGDAGAIVAHALRLAAVALANEQVGGAARCLDMAVEYAKERVQFNRPIGSFQAIKHMLADRLLDNESAAAAAAYSAWAADNLPDDLPPLADLCKAFCSDAYFDAATTNVQVHGGIGFTWEHDAHLYLRRAIATKALLGSPEAHREAIAARLLDGDVVPATA
jgi:alkylation response protein AidB-like acyl-CoA dehydrogenase